MKTTTISIRDLTSDDLNDVEPTTRASRALTKSELHIAGGPAMGLESEPPMTLGTVADLAHGDTAYVWDEGMQTWWLSEIVGAPVEIPALFAHAVLANLLSTLYSTSPVAARKGSLAPHSGDARDPISRELATAIREGMLRFDAYWNRGPDAVLVALLESSTVEE